MSSTKIGDVLHDEHRSTLAALDILDGIVDLSAPPPFGPGLLAQLDQIDAALEDDVRCHFAFEEEWLFPGLRQAGAGFMVDLLTSEHAGIRPKAQEIRDTIAAIRDAQDIAADQWSRLRTVGRSLIDMETFHIQKEEMGLLSALGQVLSPEQDAALLRTYQQR